jgi:hypothetical protein
MIRQLDEMGLAESAEEPDHKSGCCSIAGAYGICTGFRRIRHGVDFALRPGSIQNTPPLRAREQDMF